MMPTSIDIEPHQWCNGERVCLECGHHGFDPMFGQTKDYELVFAAFQLSTQYYGIRA